MTGKKNHNTNPVTKLNAGLVELIKNGDQYDVVLRLLSADNDGNVTVAFESQRL
jgi:hypothetical protein